KNWFLDVAFFHNRYQNFIEPIEEMDDHFNVFVQFRNITDAKVTGVEFSTRSDWWHNRLGIRANITWMDAVDLSSEKFLSYRPRFQGTLTPIVRFGAAEIHGDYRYTSRYDEVKLYDLDDRVPQHIVNLRLLYYWQRFQFMLTLNNATNYHYVQLERNLGTVRHLKFTLNYDL
ncbi:TonB-dependent receptor, partial [bacterium]|nr:TonB-dependent receptor [bacterium]